MKLTEDVSFIRDITTYLQRRDQFIPSLWFYGQHINVFLRNGPRWIQGGKTHALTVSNVTSKSPGNGLYSELLAYVETLGDVVVIENVLLPEQHGIYLRRGYQLYEQCDLSGIASFYKIVDRSSK